MSAKKATFIGLMAILFFSTVAGMIRSVSEGLGPVGGAASIYSLASVLLFFTQGFPEVKKFPRLYLYLGSLLFVSYEVCLSLSLGFAHTHAQTIEVGMVNYLWPGLTILMAVLFKQQKASLLIIPGMLLSFTGLCWVLGGEAGLSVASVTASVQNNPLSFGMAFAGAIIWSLYCILTRQKAEGKNGITLFFMLTALTLWGQYALSPASTLHFNVHVMGSLALAAAALGCGYAAWNIGILHGNVTVLATASYFIPLFSSALAAFILSTTLTASFWQGAAMVSVGSLICWRSTQKTKQPVISSSGETI
ncbi:MAG: aromatic amino acid DMT transporter YddG [Rouxiella badensis]|uniref:aromatic amino acid DMT transporter YddG n=1 Tax=Rouxiella badensis TaxID=1646377 RepID=UPI003C3AA759